MKNKNDNAAPTKEESINYFKGLPPCPRIASESGGNSAHRRGGPVQAVPDALGMMDAPSDDNDNNLAEVGKDEAIVVAFADGVSAANRSAVLLSMKFAEAVARAKDNGNADRIDWLENYDEAMFYSGWLGLGGKQFTAFTSSDTSLTMDSLVIDLISAVAGPNKASVLQLLSLALDKLQGDAALMTLFEKNSKKGSISSFRIMPCLESPTGIPVTYLLAMEVDYSSQTGGALFWKWSVSRLSIREMVSGLNFDLDAHNDNKDRIKNYLNGNAEDFFEGLPNQ